MPLGVFREYLSCAYAAAASAAVVNAIVRMPFRFMADPSPGLELFDWTSVDGPRPLDEGVGRYLRLGWLRSFRSRPERSEMQSEVPAPDQRSLDQRSASSATIRPRSISPS